MSQNGLRARVRDTDGLANFIFDNLGGLEDEFFEELVRKTAARTGISAPKDSQVKVIVGKVREFGLDLVSGKVEEGIVDLLTETSRESKWARHVDLFTQTNNIYLSFRRRDLVLASLDRLAVPPANEPALIAQVIDDISRGSGTDPVQLTRPIGRTTAWDFQVDLFDDAAAQIVLVDNVRAAGALMWCYDIGERLGVYKLVDSLVYRWWIGLVDFGDPSLTAELYRYYKLRDERPDEEERFLLYRRILNLGSVKVNARVPVNTEFPHLWRTLMEEVALYIDRSEASFRERVNTQGVAQAIREIQYNLTERMAGMALTQVTEMYNQLKQTETDSGVLGALDILSQSEVVGQLASGRRRDQWSVIERLAKEEFGASPNVSALRTSAVEGFHVVDYIANFRDGVFDEDAFEAFIASAKAWILAQRLAGDGLLVDPSADAVASEDTADYEEFEDPEESSELDDQDRWSE
jgi:hypothetical protein